MVRERFCFLCGEVTEDLTDGLCRLCYVDEKREVMLPEKIGVSLCRSCNRLYEGPWTGERYSGDDPIQSLGEKVVEKQLRHNLETPQVEVTVTGSRRDGKSWKGGLEVRVSGSKKGVPLVDVLHTRLEVKEGLCPTCTLKAGGYYEAVLQFRGERIEEVMAEFHHLLEGLEEKDKMAFIAGETEIKGGFDIKLGSSKAAKRISSFFKKHHQAWIKESVTLIGRKEGRDVYRNTYLIRL